MAFMADQESNVAAFGGSGGHGMSGSWSMIILVVVVLWLLFKDGNNNHDNGHYYGHGGHGHGNCNYVKDMPSYMVDRDVLTTTCETKAVAAAEGEKTRALISHNQERADDKAYQQLAMQSLQQENAIQTLKLENNFQTRLAILGNEVERGFSGLNNIVEGINCNMVKRPPYYAQGFVPAGSCIPPERSCV